LLDLHAQRDPALADALGDGLNIESASPRSALERWHSHADESRGAGRLAQWRSGLDGAFEELEKGRGEKWRSPAIAGGSAVMGLSLAWGIQIITSSATGDLACRGASMG